MMADRAAAARDRGPDRGVISDVVPALAGAGMKRARRREREVPAGGCCNETTEDSHRLKSRSRHAGRRAARCAAAPEDFDDHHAAATARAWRAMIGAVPSGSAVSCAAAGSAVGIGAAISSLARAILALQPALASSP